MAMVLPGRRSIHQWASGLLVLIYLTALGRAEPPKMPPLFEKDILPILQAKCMNCHGAEKQRAGLDLRGKAAILKGGESGPAISVGSAEKSELWIKIAADKMPPAGK